MLQVHERPGALANEFEVSEFAHRLKDGVGLSRLFLVDSGDGKPDMHDDIVADGDLSIDVGEAHLTLRAAKVHHARCQCGVLAQFDDPSGDSKTHGLCSVGALARQSLIVVRLGKRRREPCSRAL